MSINVPISNEEFYVYGGDNAILQNAAANTILTDDLVCSLSLQKGGSVKIIIDELFSKNNFSKIVCVDPYGNVELTLTQYGANINSQIFGFEWDSAWGDGVSLDQEIKIQYNFSNELRDSVVPVIHNYAKTQGMDFKFLNIGDTEFYQTYQNGITYYLDNTSVTKNTYKLVYVDRDPTTNNAIEATNFFKDKLVSGGLIIYDDYTLYNFTPVDELLMENDFTLVESGDWKVVYKKN